jgi:hypothetical protein
MMIIIFGLATIRTLVPLAKKENFTFGSIALATTMCWAYYHLLVNCATITFSVG